MATYPITRALQVAILSWLAFFAITGVALYSIYDLVRQTFLTPSR